MANVTTDPPPPDEVHGLQLMLSRLWRGNLSLVSTGSLLTLGTVGLGTVRWVYGSATGVLDWVFDHATTRVAIQSGHELNTFVIEWIERHVLPNRRTKYFKLRKVDESEWQALLPATTPADGSERPDDGPPFECLPQFVKTWFFHDGHLFTVTRGSERKRFTADIYDTDDSRGDNPFATTVHIACLSLSDQPIIKFLETCRKEAKEFSKKLVELRIYNHLDRSYGQLVWFFKSKVPARPLSSIHLDDHVRKDLLEDFESYLNPATRNRYLQRNLPYQRGYLFHGPPGTGKSTLASVLAGHYGLSLYVLQLSLIDNSSLEQLFQTLPPRCIVLMEDVDVAVVDREEDDYQPKSNRPQSSRAATLARGDHRQSKCTLSGILNVLDGIGAQKGRIVIMTTNYPEDLDSALIRPGRIDKKVYLGHISRGAAEEMFMRMFQPFERDEKTGELTEKVTGESQCEKRAEVLKQASEFGKLIPEGEITPSELQGFFQRYLNSPDEALGKIEDWIAERRADVEEAARAREASTLEVNGTAPNSHLSSDLGESTDSLLEQNSDTPDQQPRLPRELIKQVIFNPGNSLPVVCLDPAFLAAASESEVHEYLRLLGDKAERGEIHSFLMPTSVMNGSLEATDN